MNVIVSGNVITIEGNIKSVSDYQSLKASIDGVIDTEDSIVVNIKDSISMTSSIIGYFNKIILKDKINVDMTIGNAELMELIDDLNLRSLFHAKQG
jgi:hypothetical protein